MSTGSRYSTGIEFVNVACL